MDSEVLLVTDDAALAGSTAEALRTRSLQLVPCEPAQSLSKAAVSAPAMILLDLEIHSRTWSAVLNALLTEPRTRGIPVAAITRSPGINVLPVIAGVHDVLELPLDAERLERLSILLLSLSFQFGSGGNTPGEATAERLVLYIERSGASGTLQKGPPAAPIAQAVFSVGSLASAQFGVNTGRPALAAMLAKPADLRFQEEASAPVELAPEKVETLDAIPLEAMEPIPETPATTEKPVILAVDDDADLLGLIAAYLRREGFEVHTAADGEDGFAAAIQIRPDAIVSDLEMPVLDGWGLLRKIRGDHRVSDTPLLFLSSAEDFRMSVQASAAGAQDYLSKSGAREQLGQRLHAVLAPRHELEAAIRATRPARSRVELVGARWTLLRFAALAPRGSVILADGFGVYEAAFEEGEIRLAEGRVGDLVLTGAPALAAMLKVRSGDLAIGHAVRKQPNLSGPLSAAIEEAAARNNKAESLAVTKALSGASGLQVDKALCELYLKFGPLAGRPIAAELASGTAPVHLIVKKSGRSPTEVEAILRDLARRGILRVG